MNQTTGKSTLQLPAYFWLSIRLQTFRVINEPMEYLPLFEKALKSIVDSLATNKELFKRDDEFYIGFEGAIPHREVNPRTLSASEHLGKLVVLEGIVTRCKTNSISVPVISISSLMLRLFAATQSSQKCALL